MSATLDWQSAREVIRQAALQFRSPELEEIPLNDAHGRVLAKDAVADRDFPALRRSLRDGFAVQSSDLPGALRVRGERRAGDDAFLTLQGGEAVEIMTGAPVPEGADAVLMIEQVERSGDTVHFGKTTEAGQFINAQGTEAKRGTTLVPSGTRLDAAHIAALASAGYVRVAVYRRPNVAVVATGDELVEDNVAPEPHQIRNSNSRMLTALVRQSGGEARVLPIAPDDPRQLTSLLQTGMENDMLLVSGGVSAGRYDFVKPCLRECGVEFLFERVRIQPGQPTAFGTRGAKPVFGLPGNPGSTLVTFQVFAQLALQYLGGEAKPQLPITYVPFAKAFRHKAGLTRFLPALLEQGQLTHIPWQGSSDIPALARANVFLIADGERETWDIGDHIPVLPKL